MISFRKPGEFLTPAPFNGAAANEPLLLKISEFNCTFHGSPLCRTPMSEEEYLDFLKNNKMGAGTLLTFKSNQNVMKGHSPGLQVILKVQENLNDMRYSMLCDNKNKPNPYLLSSIPVYYGSSPIDPWVRWDDCGGFRELTEDEISWVESNDFIQTKLKSIQEAFKSGRIV